MNPNDHPSQRSLRIMLWEMSTRRSKESPDATSYTTAPFTHMLRSVAFVYPPLWVRQHDLGDPTIHATEQISVEQRYAREIGVAAGLHTGWLDLLAWLWIESPQDTVVHTWLWRMLAEVCRERTAQWQLDTAGLAWVRQTTTRLPDTPTTALAQAHRIALESTAVPYGWTYVGRQAVMTHAQVSPAAAYAERIQQRLGVGVALAGAHRS